MDTIGKTPVNIIQELIAIHTTRRDAYEKIKKEGADEQLNDKLSNHIKQSEQFIDELMNELSQFGDAVAGDVDMDNSFNNTWKESLGSVNDMSKGDLAQTVDSLEDSLHRTYRGFMDLPVEFSESLMEILEQQSAAI